MLNVMTVKIFESMTLICIIDTLDKLERLTVKSKYVISMTDGSIPVTLLTQS